MAITQCTYKREEGLHYPAGQSSSFYTKVETERKSCTGKGIPAPDSRIKPAEAKLFAKLLQANRQVRAPLFSRCFLEEMNDLALVAGREMGIQIIDGKLVALVGEPDAMVKSVDPSKGIFPAHVHARATSYSAPVSVHSFGDFHAQFYHAAKNKLSTVTLVTGRICGGKREESLVAIDGAAKRIYVYNDAQKELIEKYLDQFYNDPEGIIGAGTELRRAKIYFQDCQVVTSPEEANRLIEEYKKKYQINPKLEEQLMADLRTKVRAAGPPASPSSPQKVKF